MIMTLLKDLLITTFRTLLLDKVVTQYKVNMIEMNSNISMLHLVLSMIRPIMVPCISQSTKDSEIALHMSKLNQDIRRLVRTSTKNKMPSGPMSKQRMVSQEIKDTSIL